VVLKEYDTLGGNTASHTFPRKATPAGHKKTNSSVVLPGASGVGFVSHAMMFREGAVVGGALGGRPFSLVTAYMPLREKDATICFFGGQLFSSRLILCDIVTLD
jgi:hypothetical protein